MKKIFVIGGAGYIGSHTVLELLAKKYQVVVIDDLRSGYKELLPADILLEKVSLENREDVFRVFEKHQPEAVIDFAAYLAVGESMIHPEKYLRNNVLNFINILDAMVKFNCRFIIKSSTAAVYGNPTKENDVPWVESFTETYKPKKAALLEGKWANKDVVGEEFLQKFLERYSLEIGSRQELILTNEDFTKLRIPLSVYGVSKLLDEIILEKYNKTSSIGYVAFRYFNVCGADPSGRTGDSKPRPTNLMPMAILSALNKIPELSVYGNDYPTKDGTGIRDYIHPSDLAVAHVLAIKYLESGNKSEIFNLATGHGSSVLEVIKAVESASGKKVKYKITDRRSGDASISVADASKAEKILGWKTEYNLTDMAKTAWKWESQNKERILEK